jgi:hypothetical protein
MELSAQRKEYFVTARDGIFGFLIGRAISKGANSIWKNMLSTNPIEVGFAISLVSISCLPFWMLQRAPLEITIPKNTVIGVVCGILYYMW